jgi:hypothetical protein
MFSLISIDIDNEIQELTAQEVDIKEYDKNIKVYPHLKLKHGTPGVTALELIKRAYESNTLDKLRDFLSAEAPHI